ERLQRAAARGVVAPDWTAHDDVPAAVRELTGGRGPDAVIDAGGVEAHEAPLGKRAQAAAGLLPDGLAAQRVQNAGADRLTVLHAAIDTVRRGVTISISGVYGGVVAPLPMMTLFDKQIQLRMGQANVRRWTDAILPLLTEDGDPLGVDDFATHRVPLDRAPEMYETFQRKQDG